MKFTGDIIDIKIAGSEKEVSKTIEELLALNKRLSKHTDKEIMDTTEKQLEKGDYDTKSSRGEQTEVTERQLDHKDEPDFELVEVRARKESPQDGGHNPSAWDKDKEKVRGHQNVSPLWHEVYKKEDARKDNGDLKKQLKK